MIAPALVLTGVFSIIATLQVFNEPQTLAPLTNTISPDWMPLMRVYDLAFNDNNSYEAAALSVIIAAVMFVGSFFLLRVEQQARLPGTVSRDGTDESRRRAHRGAVRRTAGRAARQAQAPSGARPRCPPSSCCSARCTACCRSPGC